MENLIFHCTTKSIKIRKDSIVFDIGSGIGPLAILAAYEPSKTVYSVEIVKEQCELLRKNIKENNLKDKIKVYEGIIKPVIS